MDITKTVTRMRSPDDGGNRIQWKKLRPWPDGQAALMVAGSMRTGCSESETIRIAAPLKTQSV